MGRLDRYGEPIEDNDDDQPQHDPRCINGLLGEDDLGRPIACLTCRPHLIACHFCKRTQLACKRIPGRCCGACDHEPARRKEGS